MSAANVRVAVVASLSRDRESCSVAKRQGQLGAYMLMKDCGCAIQSSNDGAHNEIFPEMWIQVTTDCVVG